MDTYQPDTYGERIAGVYDDWYDFLDEAMVPVLAELGGGSGRALELGIGTGRVAIPLQQAGFSVEGIDASESMVARMREKLGGGPPGSGGEIPVTIGDFADVDVEGEYALIYVLFTTFFALLTQEDQVRCFCNVARHLEPEGSFVIEAFVPDPARLSARQTVRASEVGEDAVQLEATKFDLAKQLITSQTVLLTEQGLKLYPVKIRYVWPSELDLMAQLAGLELRQRWSSWRKEPFTASSTAHISVYGHAQP